MAEPLDVLERRLTDYADRWRDSLSEPGPLDPVVLGSARSQRGRWVGSLAAAAALVMVIGSMVVQNGTSPGVPLGGPDADVPWVALRPSDPVIPRVPAPYPYAGRATAAPICQAASVSTSGRIVVATPSYLVASWTLTSPSDCKLVGAPDLSVVGADDLALTYRTVLVGRDEEFNRPALVSDGTPLDLDFVMSGWCSAGVPRTINMAWPGGGGRLALPVEGQLPGCEGAEPMTGGALRVRPYVPIFAPTSWESDFANVSVSPIEPLSGPPNSTVSFVVSLTAHGDVVLDPCPDFVMTQYFQQHTRYAEQRYGLNCAGVPRDDQGRPILRQGTTTRFAMQVFVGDTSPEEFVWSLAVPESVRASTKIVVG